MKKRRVVPPEYVDAFCGRIKGARDAANYSQEGMAQALGVDRGTYKQYENRSVMPHDLIPEFCRLTEHHPWYILTGQSGSRSPGTHTYARTLHEEVDNNTHSPAAVHEERRAFERAKPSTKSK